MRKFHLAAILLVAASAFLTVAVSSASAAEHLLWLVNGMDFEGTLSAETEGQLTLIRLNGAGGAILNEFICEGIFDGTVTNATMQESSDKIEHVLNLLQETIGEDPLTGLPLECKVVDNGNEITDCTSGKMALVWPANLPWSTLLELMPGPPIQWLDLLFGPAGKEPGYEVECESLFFASGEELCEGNTSSLVLETLEIFLSGETIFGSHAETNWESPISSEIGTCSKTGVELVAALQGLGVTWIIEGELNRLETDVSETTG